MSYHHIPEHAKMIAKLLRLPRMELAKTDNWEQLIYSLNHLRAYDSMWRLTRLNDLISATQDELVAILFPDYPYKQIKVLSDDLWSNLYHNREFIVIDNVLYFHRDDLDDLILFKMKNHTFIFQDISA